MWSQGPRFGQLDSTAPQLGGLLQCRGRLDNAPGAGAQGPRSSAFPSFWGPGRDGDYRAVLPLRKPPKQTLRALRSPVDWFCLITLGFVLLKCFLLFYLRNCFQIRIMPRAPKSPLTASVSFSARQHFTPRIWSYPPKTLPGPPFCR